MQLLGNFDQSNPHLSSIVLLLLVKSSMKKMRSQQHGTNDYTADWYQNNRFQLHELGNRELNPIKVWFIWSFLPQYCITKL